MTLQDTIDIKMIDLLIHPFGQDKPINFKNHLIHSNKILIILPKDVNILRRSKSVKKLIELFSKQTITFILLDKNIPKLPFLKNYKTHCLHLNKQNLWHLIRSESIKQLSSVKFDILLDLNPEFSIVMPYLCRLLKCPIRIGFNKAYSDPFYNLICSMQEESYLKNIQNLAYKLHSLMH